MLVLAFLKTALIAQTVLTIRVSQRVQENLDEGSKIVFRGIRAKFRVTEANEDRTIYLVIRIVNLYQTNRIQTNRIQTDRIQTNRIQDSITIVAVRSSTVLNQQVLDRGLRCPIYQRFATGLEVLPYTRLVLPPQVKFVQASRFGARRTRFELDQTRPTY